jgi:hypothetical protein
MNALSIDEIKKLTVIALFSKDSLLQQLVLKGGNLLDLVYGISPRPSKDIDLSLRTEFDDIERARQDIEEALSNTFGEHGYVVFDVKLQERPKPVFGDSRKFWGGYKGEFKLLPHESRGLLQSDLGRAQREAVVVQGEQGRCFPIEISKYEYCDGAVEEELDGYTIVLYSPAMLTCEKLRAICQQMPEYRKFIGGRPRPRGRDFLDLHTVVSHFVIDFAAAQFHKTLQGVFSVKQVPLHLLGQIESEAVREFHRDDFEKLAPTVRPGFELQSFEFYWRFVVDRVALLEPLWNK